METPNEVTDTGEADDDERSFHLTHEQMAELQEQVEHLENEIAMRDDTIVELRQKKDRAQFVAREDELQSAIKEHEHNLMLMQEKTQQLQAKVSQHEDREATTKEEESETIQQLIYYKHLTEDLTTQLEQAKRDVDRVFTQQKAEETTLMETIKELKIKVSQQDLKIADLKFKYSHLQQEAGIRQEEFTRKEQERFEDGLIDQKALSETIRQLEHEITELQAGHDRQAGEYELLIGKVREETARSLQHKDDELREIQRRCQQMKETMNCDKQHIEELYQEMQGLRQQHKRDLDIANTSHLL